MTRIFAAFLVVGLLAACGGGNSSRDSVGRTLSLSQSAGPIYNACLRSGRKAASRPLCGCIQRTANAKLSGSDQRRGASFFGNPDRAHAVRLSDTKANDAFWARWSDFGKAARRSCG